MSVMSFKELTCHDEISTLNAEAPRNISLISVTLSTDHAEMSELKRMAFSTSEGRRKDKEYINEVKMGTFITKNKCAIRTHTVHKNYLGHIPARKV